MKQYLVTEHGLLPDGKTCNSAALARLVDEAGDNSEFLFPAGRFYFSQTNILRGKKNITFTGIPGESVIVLHYDACEPYEAYNGFFRTYDCEDLTIRGFLVTTDNPVGWSGEIVATNEAEHYYDLRVYGDFPITGKEHPVALNSCDEEGTPDYLLDGGILTEDREIEWNGKKAKIPGHRQFEIIGDRLLRFKTHDWQKFDGLEPGHKVVYRMGYGGSSVFQFLSTRRILLEDVDLRRIGFVGVGANNRSYDLTLRRFHIRRDPNSYELFSSNKDGIHLAGLCGYLHMYDCTFDGLGDDALNIHGPAGVVEAVDGDGTVQIGRAGYKGEATPWPQDSVWLMPGDIVEFYDRVTVRKTGSARVLSKPDSNHYTFTDVHGEFCPGAIVSNTVYYAATHVRGCSVRNTRARAFLFQTHNVLMEDCHIFGMSLPGVIVSPDMKLWFELGPSDNVVIRNNVFEKCAQTAPMCNLGAIVCKGSHDIGIDDYPAGVHRNMFIYGNTFRHIGNSAIYLAGVKGGEIADNTFEDCCMRNDKRAECLRYDVALFNCADITVGHNDSTRDEKDLYNTEGCQNIKFNKGENV